jgi:hypothetical protein
VIWIKAVPLFSEHFGGLYQAHRTPSEKPEGFRAAQVVGAALEPSVFSPGVSEREFHELDKNLRNFRKTELQLLSRSLECLLFSVLQEACNSCFANLHSSSLNSLSVTPVE